MRKRIRSKHNDIAIIYGKIYEHDKWEDHRLRIPMTVEMGRWMVTENKLYSVADLSCGDGEIANNVGARDVILGDFVEGYAITGMIEDTIEKIEPVDLFILSETLEHVDEPLELLKKIRGKCRFLLVTTPITNGVDENQEHYWSWDEQGVLELLKDAGFEPYIYNKLDFTLRPGYPYAFQMWGCR